MKLKDLAPVLHSVTGFVQMAIVYDTATGADLETGCSVDYAVKHYGDREVERITAENGDLVLITRPAAPLITGYFIDPENGIAEPRTIEKSLASYYSLLRCDTIDIAHRVLGDKAFDIICDDEGLLKENPCPSAMDMMGNVALVGAIFVVAFDGEDDVCSLSQEELDYVEENIGVAWNTADGEPGHLNPYLIGLDY